MRSRGQFSGGTMDKGSEDCGPVGRWPVQVVACGKMWATVPWAEEKASGDGEDVRGLRGWGFCLFGRHLRRGYPRWERETWSKSTLQDHLPSPHPTNLQRVIIITLLPGPQGSEVRDPFILPPQLSNSSRRMYHSEREMSQFLALQEKEPGPPWAGFRASVCVMGYELIPMTVGGC